MRAPRKAMRSLPLDFLKPALGFVAFCLSINTFAGEALPPIQQKLVAHSLSSEGKVAVEGGNIWYKIQGTEGKPPLLLIHGGPGGSSCSFNHLTPLGSQRPFILYDQLGAGKSTRPTNPNLWRADRFADELNSLINHLGYKKVNLLAHSWGAAVAARYLQIYGTNKIDAVIFVGPYLSSRDWTQGTINLRKNLSAKSQAIFTTYEKEGLAPTAEYRKAEEEFYAHYLFRHPPKSAGECDDNSWNQSVYETMWGDSEFKVTGNLKDFDATTILKQLNIPVLFLVGEFDESPAYISEKYHQQTKQSKLIVLKDAAHMSMIDQPDLFIQTINHFLEDNEIKAKN